MLLSFLFVIVTLTNQRSSCPLFPLPNHLAWELLSSRNYKLSDRACTETPSNSRSHWCARAGIPEPQHVSQSTCLHLQSCGSTCKFMISQLPYQLQLVQLSGSYTLIKALSRMLRCCHSCFVEYSCTCRLHYYHPRNRMHFQYYCFHTKVLDIIKIVTWASFPLCITIRLF